MANIINKIARRYTNNARQLAKVVPQTVATAKSAAANSRARANLALTNANNNMALSNAREMFNRGEFETGTQWGETKTFPKGIKDLRRYQK